jgi:hypothetical protein
VLYLIHTIPGHYSFKKIHIMQHTFISFLRYPGGENEGGGTEPNNEEVKAGDQQPDSADGTHHEKKGFIDKVKDALRDWSNDDQQDQAIDDATP